MLHPQPQEPSRAPKTEAIGDAGRPLPRAPPPPGRALRRSKRPPPGREAQRGPAAERPLGRAKGSPPPPSRTIPMPPTHPTSRS